MQGRRGKRTLARALVAAGIAASAVLALSSCASGGDAPGDGGASAPEPGFTRCVEPRHPACTRDYRPVCARTSEASDDADGWKTYPNACSACADAAVIGHRAGECPGS